MKPQTTKNKNGRPTSYKDEYAKHAYKLCLLGATDAELGDFFEVNEATINRWKHKHREFCASIKKGKSIAGANVAESLYKRAIGYSHPDVHISNYQGEITITDITKHYLPDTAACFIWLKNRQPQKWRDKQELTVNHQLDKAMMNRLETEMVAKMAAARKRQKEVLAERGLS